MFVSEPPGRRKSAEAENRRERGSIRITSFFITLSLHTSIDRRDSRSKNCNFQPGPLLSLLMFQKSRRRECRHINRCLLLLHDHLGDRLSGRRSVQDSPTAVTGRNEDVLKAVCLFGGQRFFFDSVLISSLLFLSLLFPLSSFYALLFATSSSSISSHLPNDRNSIWRQRQIARLFCLDIRVNEMRGDLRSDRFYRFDLIYTNK